MIQFGTIRIYAHPCRARFNTGHALHYTSIQPEKGGTIMRHVANLTCASAIAAAVAAVVAVPGLGNDITKEWGGVKPPPVPEVKPVTVDPRTTALLVLDFMKGNCGVRPRCVATVPEVKKLLEQARAHNMMVAYTLVGADPTPAGMIDQGLAPRASEFLVKNSGGADKFVGSNLDEGLKQKGIT